MVVVLVYLTEFGFEQCDHEQERVERAFDGSRECAFSPEGWPYLVYRLKDLRGERTIFGSFIESVEVVGRFRFGDLESFNGLSYGLNLMEQPSCFIGTGRQERMIKVSLGEAWDYHCLSKILDRVVEGDTEVTLLEVASRVADLQDMVAALTEMHKPETKVQAGADVSVRPVRRRVHYQGL